MRKEEECLHADGVSLHSRPGNAIDDCDPISRLIKAYRRAYPGVDHLHSRFGVSSFRLLGPIIVQLKASRR